MSGDNDRSPSPPLLRLSWACSQAMLDVLHRLKALWMSSSKRLKALMRVMVVLNGLGAPIYNTHHRDEEGPGQPGFTRPTCSSWDIRALASIRFAASRNLGHQWQHNLILVIMIWDSFRENCPTVKNASRLNRYTFPTDNANDFLYSTLYTTPFHYEVLKIGSR